MKSMIQNVCIEARKKIALNQSDFGRLMKCQISSVSRYERGIKTPPEDYLNACKNLLKTPLKEISALRSAFLNESTDLLNRKKLNEIELT